jgi:hypothetical protein
MTLVATFPALAHDWLAHELDRQLYRRAGVIKSGSGIVTTGTVLGKVMVAGATSAAKTGGNTGDGTLTLDTTTPVLADAVAGVYKVRFTEAAANGGQYQVENPAGVVIGTANVGDTWAEGIKFVIADGATDFVVGDGFDVTVAAGSLKYVPLDLDAVDGSQTAAAIVIDRVDATSADKQTAILIGHAQIVPLNLNWPDGATTNQKNAALAQLEALGIVSHQRF